MPGFDETRWEGRHCTHTATWTKVPGSSPWSSFWSLGSFLTVIEVSFLREQCQGIWLGDRLGGDHHQLPLRHLQGQSLGWRPGKTYFGFLSTMLVCYRCGVARSCVGRFWTTLASLLLRSAKIFIPYICYIFSQSSLSDLPYLPSFHLIRAGCNRPGW